MRWFWRIFPHEHTPYPFVEHAGHPFDILVHDCWADEVAAGRGIEGQIFNSGRDWRMFSTAQKAWDSGAMMCRRCGRKELKDA